MDLIKVQFRKDCLGVFCVFPYEIQNDLNVLCYAHEGQHSTCLWSINEATKQAKKEEYQNLLNELIEVYKGSILMVIKKRNHSEYLKAYYNSKRKSHAS
jgi:Zn-finger protein